MKVCYQFFEYYPDAAPWCHMACKKDGTPLVASSYEMCDITYVDDECLCLDAGTNDELLEKLPRALDIMQGVFTRHFLEVNWKPLKTECVLHLVGRGTKHAWKTIERSAEQRAAAGPGAAKHVCRTLVGSSATFCRVTITSDHWSMVLVVWNVSYKRALLLQTECTSRLPRNS